MTMYLIERDGKRPICPDCRRAVGPAGRKRWRCLPCRYERAIAAGDTMTADGIDAMMGFQELHRRNGAEARIA